MNEPTEITIGDSASWQVDLPYRSNDGWTLKYSFASLTVPGFTVIASGNADGSFTVNLTTTDSAKFTAAGKFEWAAFVTKAAQKITVATGRITANAAIVDGAVVDNRTHAQKVLDAIEATIENRATYDQTSLSYSTNNGSRSIQHSSLNELLVAREVYRKMVDAEQAAVDGGKSRNFNIRFVRV